MSKNKLQEYCQKNNIGFPSYETKKEGADHQATFTSKVKICLNGSNILKARGGVGRTKTEAEISAATALLEKIAAIDATQIRRTKKISRAESKELERELEIAKASFADEESPRNKPHLSIAIVIDLENKPCSSKNFEMLKNYRHDFDIVGIMSKNGVVNIKTDLPTKIVNSTRSDAADAAIIAYITKLVIKKKYRLIIVISSDKLIGAIEDVINTEDFISKGQNEVVVKQAINVKDMETLFNSSFFKKLE